MTTTSNEYAVTLIEKIIVDQEKYLRHSKFGRFVYKGRQIREYYGEWCDKKICSERAFKNYIGSCLPDITEVLDNIDKFPEEMLISCHQGKYIETVGRFRKLIAEKTPILIEYVLGKERIEAKVLTGTTIKEAEFDIGEKNRVLKYDCRPLTDFAWKDFDAELPWYFMAS